MKTIILYTDNYAPVRNLSADRKAVLFDAVFRYSLGEELPEMDEVTAVAFAFLKNSIDHATDASEELRAKKSAAGKKGMESRWHSDDYNTNNNVKSDISKITPNNVSKVKISEEKISEEKGVIADESAYESNRPILVDEVAASYRTSAAFEQFAAMSNLTLHQAGRQLDRYVQMLKASGVQSKTRKDFATHLINWSKYNPFTDTASRPAVPSAFANLEPL